jgi:2-keto-3-deoxy-L-rhamnonate aldolase RhmA
MPTPVRENRAKTMRRSKELVLCMGVTPIARVTSHDPHDATRILDCGAQGVMVPHIQNAKEAKDIVQACLHAPKGHRSAFGSGPAARISPTSSRPAAPT